MEFNLENPFTSLEQQQSDTLLDLFATESDHMPSPDFIQCLKITDFYISFRQEAVSLILQVQFSCQFEPFISYLAVTYLDRFISRKEIPQGKPWILRLLVASCISLAAKMKNTHFLPSKLQSEEGDLTFDARTIHRMELLILDALNWRMRSVTPFSFLCLFISLFEPRDPPFTRPLKHRATEIIFKAQNEIRLLEFKPSVIAASAVLLSSLELFPLQFPSLKTSILTDGCVNEENLLNCFDTMQEMVEMEGCESILDTVSSSRSTPFIVLNYECTKSESGQITTTTTSGVTTENVMPEKRATKRRKMNPFCSRESKFQLPRIQHCRINKESGGAQTLYFSPSTKNGNRFAEDIESSR